MRDPGRTDLSGKWISESSRAEPGKILFTVMETIHKSETGQPKQKKVLENIIKVVRTVGK